MVTKLHGLVERELSTKDRTYVISPDEERIKLTLERRRWQELKWKAHHYPLLSRRRTNLVAGVLEPDADGAEQYCWGNVEPSGET